MRTFTQSLVCLLVLFGFAVEAGAQTKLSRRVRNQKVDLNRIFGVCGCTECNGRLEHNEPYTEEESENNFFIVTRWTSTVLSGGGLGQGDPTMITWSIVPDGTDANGGAGFVPSNLIAVFDNLFNEANAGDPDLTNRFWFGLIQDGLDRWGEVSGVEYVYEPNDDGVTNFNAGGVLGVRGDVRIGGFNIDGGGNVLAFNSFPNNGDMALDTADTGLYGNAGLGFRLFRNVITHEQGHGLGFAHLESNNAAFLMEPFITGSFDGPQLDDVRGVHRQYGDVLEKSNDFQGNDTIATATELGTIADGQQVVIGTDGATGTVVAPNDIDFVSVDDNNDDDFFSFTIDELGFVTVTLTPVGAPYNQSQQGGGGGTPITTVNSSNLTLTLFNSSGSPIQIANTQPTGSAEVIADEFLLAGEYFVRATGSANTVQLYTLAVAYDGLDVPEDTAPSIVAYESGETLSGDASDMLTSDDQDFRMIPNLDGIPDETGITALFTFFSPDVIASQFGINYEGSANTLNLDQTLSVFNSNTGLFEEFDSGAVGLSDGTAVFSAGANPQDYISNPTGLVLVEAKYEPVGPVFFYPWTVSIDRLVISTLGP